MADYAAMLPNMLFGEALRNELTVLPDYNTTIRDAEASVRLMKLSDIYKIFIPGKMAIEIYHKLYMMTSMSFSQKGSMSEVKRLNENHRWATTGEFHGVATGATSATVIGCSGIGKSTCIRKAMNLLGGIIECDKPYRKLIPALIVSTPFDCNYKGLLCQILIAIDETLGTNYYEKSQKSTMNAQQILGMVAQLCQQFVGTLIIDEIQFIVQHKSGQQLYRMILQLINTSCNILLVGTNECLPFFTQNQSAFQMARRSVGLQYEAMEYGNEFSALCSILFSYQYVSIESEITDGIISWLYEHTRGNPSTLVSLFHDAQEIAILEGDEYLGIETLTKAYNQRFQMLHNYIAANTTPKKKTSSTAIPKIQFPKNENPKTDFVFGENLNEFGDVEEYSELDYVSIDVLVAESKISKVDITTLMKKHFAVVEVEI